MDNAVECLVGVKYGTNGGAGGSDGLQQKRKAAGPAPTRNVEEFIAKYDREVGRRVRLFNIRDVEEVKADFYERILEQRCFEKYDERKIKGWDTRPAVQNFERYIFHILRTCLINRSNRQRMIDSRMVSVEQMATAWSEDEEGSASEAFYGGMEDTEDKTKAPFSLEDILDMCHVFSPRMYKEVEGKIKPVSVEVVAQLIADGNSEVDISQQLGISSFMLEALMADLRVVASMLEVRIRGLLEGGAV